MRYSELRLEFKTVAKLCYDAYIEKIANNLKSNPKSFFEYVNQKRKVKNIPSVMTFNDITLKDLKDIVSKFADFFESVYEPHDQLEGDHTSAYLVDWPNTFDIPNITIDEVANVLNHIDTNTGPGPDGIPPSLLKACSSSFAIPLNIIFNRSLLSAVFPRIWKESFIRPIFKGGHRSHIKNYRGIAKLSIIPKAFEKIVTDKLFEFISPSISIYQHGFVKGRSTVTNLATFTSSVTCSLENGSQTDCIYTDFSKAFDKINHSILLRKLQKQGCSNDFCDWTASYLNARKQFVKIGSSSSRCFTASSGVPQGSHLGPILFIIFIDDITTIIKHSLSLLYADDLKLYKAINTLGLFNATR